MSAFNHPGFARVCFETLQGIVTGTKMFSHKMFFLEKYLVKPILVITLNLHT